MPSHSMAGGNGALLTCGRWVAAPRIRRGVCVHVWRRVADRLAGLGAELAPEPSQCCHGCLATARQTMALGRLIPGSRYRHAEGCTLPILGKGYLFWGRSRGSDSHQLHQHHDTTPEWGYWRPLLVVVAGGHLPTAVHCLDRPGDSAKGSVGNGLVT